MINYINYSSTGVQSWRRRVKITLKIHLSSFRELYEKDKSDSYKSLAVPTRITTDKKPVFLLFAVGLDQLKIPVSLKKRKLSTRIFKVNHRLIVLIFVDSWLLRSNKIKLNFLESGPTMMLSARIPR